MSLQMPYTVAALEEEVRRTREWGAVGALLTLPMIFPPGGANGKNISGETTSGSTSSKEEGRNESSGNEAKNKSDIDGTENRGRIKELNDKPIDVLVKKYKQLFDHFFIEST